MSIKILKNLIYLKDKATGNLEPVAMFGSGADKSMAEIKEYADTAASTIEEKKAEGVNAIQEILDTIPENYPTLTEDVSTLKTNVGDMNILLSYINKKYEKSFTDISTAIRYALIHKADIEVIVKFVTNGLIANFEVSNLLKWNDTEITDSVGGFKATGITTVSGKRLAAAAPTITTNGMANVGGIYCESSLSDMGIVDGFTIDFAGTLKEKAAGFAEIMQVYDPTLTMPKDTLYISDLGFNDTATALPSGLYHFTMTMVDGSFSCYRNGEFKYTGNISLDWSDMISSFWAMAASSFSACSDVHIYNRILTEDEIVQNYNYAVENIEFNI